MMMLGLPNALLQGQVGLRVADTHDRWTAACRGRSSTASAIPSRSERSSTESQAFATELFPFIS
ncbi:unnamed protein product [Ectocarpus sp. 8 AP-2014]